MAFIPPEIGIDLGSTNISVYVRKRGIVVSEPAILVIDKEDQRQVRAVGDEASYLLGRATNDLIPVEPIRAGLPTHFELAQILIKYFVRKAIGNSYIGRPTILVSAPCGMKDIDEKALREAVVLSGTRGGRVHIIQKPFLAGIGSGLPVYDPVGSMVVDIGGGTTDVAVLSLGGVVISQSIQVGGMRMDQAIMDYMQREFQMSIGRQTAEAIKMDLASAMPLTEPRTITVRGRDQQHPRAMTVELSSTQAYEAIREPCKAILAAIRWVLERTPPELAADIMRTGIHLTGGCAQLFALDQYISSELGIPVLLAREPADCTILGLGYLTENIHLVTGTDKHGN